MPRGVWSKKDERQYKAIVSSCRKKKGKKKKSLDACKRMAAATVNKFRQKQGRTQKAKKGKRLFYCLVTGMFRAKRGLRCFTTEQARANASRRGVFGSQINIWAPKGTKASALYVRSGGRGSR